MTDSIPQTIKCTVDKVMFPIKSFIRKLIAARKKRNKIPIKAPPATIILNP